MTVPPSPCHKNVKDGVDMEFKNLLLETSEGICTIKINNPQSLNALNDEVLKELSAAFDLASDDRDVSIIVLTGEGKAFVAGADIAHMSRLGVEEAKKWFKEEKEYLTSMLDRNYNLSSLGIRKMEIKFTTMENFRIY